jgi:putative acetyltransferase
MIRKYKDEDIDELILSWRKATELAHPFLTPGFLEKEAYNVQNVYPVLAEIWVTEIDGAVVGFIALVENDIGGLFLDPRYHGRGLGRAMVDKAVAEKGDLSVEVFAANKVGRHFYDAYGFRETEQFVHEGSGQNTCRLVFQPLRFKDWQHERETK